MLVGGGIIKQHRKNEVKEEIFKNKKYASKFKQLFA